VHFLRKNLVGKRILQTLVQDDDIVYGKVGTSASQFKNAMTGKRILDVGQQGKYFWLVADSPPHPVLHLGMNGWVKFSNVDSGAYKTAHKPETEWPPKYWKFLFQTETNKDEEKYEVAFVDSRRLARIRLVDVDGSKLRQTTPLKENGPDPVVDKDILTVEWLGEKMRSKKVPIKALLLDQANISGVGNWVADEVLYQARIHPEQYSNTFDDQQIKVLHDALIFVCTTAVDTLADTSQFPKDWLMKYRWGKGKKERHYLPNGEEIVHITVGGRTSAVVLSRQQKTGPVSEQAEKAEEEAEGKNNGNDVDGDEDVVDKKVTKTKETARKRKRDDSPKEAIAERDDTAKPTNKKKGRSRANSMKNDDAATGAKDTEVKEKTPKAQRKARNSNSLVDADAESSPPGQSTGLRRSSRIKGRKT